MVPNRLALDTSAYNLFQTGHPKAVRRIDREAWVGIPAITIGELDAGFRLGSRYDSNRDLLDRFPASPVVDRVDVDDKVAQIYSQIFASLRRSGRPLPTNDVWIAAVRPASAPRC